MEYFSAIKKKKIETVLVRWMSLEPVKQSDVSQKEKKNCILMHIYGFYKNGTDDFKSYIYIYFRLSLH